MCMYSICNPVSLFLTNAAAQTDLRPDPRQSPLSRQHTPDLPTGNSNLSILLPIQSLSLVCTRPNYFASASQTLFLSFPNRRACAAPPMNPFLTTSRILSVLVAPKKENLNILISANSSSCPPLLTVTVSTKDVNN